MSPKNINSISEFLLHAGTEYFVYDMGRRLVPTDTQAFLDIENGAAYAPYPRQQHAWFGIVFWNKNASTQHYIWFVKLPLDEQGLVIAAARNHFLDIIIDALGQSVAEDTEKAQKLPDNPYSFVPGQTLLAQFNAMVKTTLNQTLNDDTQKVEAYIQAPQLADWQQLSMQSVADFVYSLPTHERRDRLVDALLNNHVLYSEVFFNTIMEMCENIDLPETMQSFFIEKLTSDANISLAALRGLSSGEYSGTLNNTLTELLQNKNARRIDVLSVVAARHFVQMDDTLLAHFLEQAALVDEQEGHNGALFSGFFSDLVQIPKLRRQVLALLRSPGKSPHLSSAFDNLFAQARQ